MLMPLLTGLSTGRREILAVLLAFAAAGSSRSANAQTFTGPGTSVTLPADIHWSTPAGAPPRSFESVMLAGDLDGAGPYLTLLRWYPGYMSAPHQYLTDRLSLVISGTWWVDSASDFDPQRCQPVGPGTFVHRKANTPHYDGVIANAPEAETIAIFGLAPVGIKFVDPNGQSIRRV
jgi:hypothetical protein